MQHFFQIRRIIVRISRTYISNIPLYSQQGRRLICSCQAFDYSFTSIRIAEREREKYRQAHKPWPKPPGYNILAGENGFEFLPFGAIFQA